MRQVLSLSFPPQTTTKIKQLAKKRGFESVSGYIQHLIILDRELISEERLWKSVKQARQEYKAGKTVKAKSIAELI